MRHLPQALIIACLLLLLLTHHVDAALPKATPDRLPKKKPTSPRLNTGGPPKEVAPIIQLQQHSTTLNQIVQRYSTVVIYVSDSLQRCGRECAHFLHQFVRATARLEEEGFDTHDVAYAQLHGSENPQDMALLRNLAASMNSGSRLPMPAVVTIVDKSVVSASIEEGSEDVTPDTTGVHDAAWYATHNEQHWMDAISPSALKWRDEQRLTAAASKNMSGVEAYAHKALVVVPPDDYLGEELPAFLHRYSGPAIKVAKSETQLRFRIFEAHHADKISMVFWELPKEQFEQLPPQEQERRNILRTTFKKFASRNRLRNPFTTTKFVKVRRHERMSFHYNPYHEDIVAYIVDRDANDGVGYRPEGFNWTMDASATEAKRTKSAMSSLNEFVESIQRERHSPRRACLEHDLEEIERTGTYNASRYFRTATFREPKATCNTRRVVPGDTIQVIMHGRSVATASEFLQWPAPGVVLTVGSSSAGIPKLLHQAFIGMCVGMRRQAVMPKPPARVKPKKGRPEPFSKSLLEEGDTFGIEMVAFYGEPKLSFEAQKSFDATRFISRWRDEELRQWNKVERRLWTQQDKSKWMF